MVYPDGRGIAGVEVGCLETERMETWERERSASLESLARPGARALTDPDGAFRLDEIPAGRIRLVSVAEDRPAAASELVDVPAGGLVLDVLIRMEEEDGGTTISGIVLSPDRRPAAHASVVLRGRPVQAHACVLAGEVTRVDLWLEDREEEQGKCRLTGRLTIDGNPAEGWVVALDQERATVRQGQAFIEPGLFRIGAGEPGSYRLRLSSGSQDPSTMLVLFDPVELLAGERYWSLELRTGALEGSMSAEDPAEALVFFRWQRGTVQAFVRSCPARTVASAARACRPGTARSCAATRRGRSRNRLRRCCASS